MSSMKITSKTMHNPNASLEVLIYQTAWRTSIFLLMEITETPQIHGLNHNHYLSSKICFSFVPNIILNSFHSFRYKISSHLWLLPLLPKCQYWQNQFFHNVPNFVIYFISPLLLYIRSSFLSVLLEQPPKWKMDLETKNDKWRPSCQHLCLTDICPFASSGQKLTFLKARPRLKLRPHHNMISTFLSGPITCLSCLCIWALPSKQIRQIPQSASSRGFALPVLFHTRMWKFNSSFKSRFVFQTTLQNPT